MSEREYKRVTQQLKPFITLFIVVVGSSFLASCGGGNGAAGLGDTTASVSSADAPNVTAQAVSGGTVPAGWKGRVPTFVQRLISSDGGISNGTVNLPSSGIIVRNHLYLNINPGITEGQVSAWAKANGAKILGSFDSFGTILVEKEFTNQAGYEALSQLFIQSGLFSSVEPELKGSLNSIDDPILKTQQGRWNFDAISLFGAWSLLPESAVGIPRIGVFDGGFRRDHQDLIFGSVSTIFTDNAALGAPAYCALDSKGTILSIDECTNADHGMHVAGIIGANGNNLGSSGVIRYASGTIDAYKFIDGGSLELSDAIKKFSAKGDNIINLSYGFKLTGRKYPSSALKRSITTQLKPFGDAIKKLIDAQYYILIVQAAGNDFGTEMMIDGTLKAVTAEYSGYAASYLYGDLLDKNANDFSAIKKYIQDNSLVVGAFYLDEFGNRKISPGSSRPPLGGANDNFILAPGGKFEWVKNDVGDFESRISNTITSTLYNVPYGATIADGRGAAGTSMAAPHVTGVAALIRQANDKLAIADIKNLILSTSDTSLGTPFKDRKDGDGSDGYRYLNAEAAVREAIHRKAPEADCGTVTPPAAVDQSGPTYVVISNRATRFSTLPAPKPNYPFGAYRWKTSEGTEILSNIERANITFYVSSGASIHVTPVLMDGTVCTGSTKTSNVDVNIPEWKINPANNHRYEVVSCGTWLQCRDNASALGGKLATIRNEDENYWLSQSFGNKVGQLKSGFWLGLNNADGTGGWVWDSAEPVGYTKWNSAANLNIKPGFGYLIVGGIYTGSWLSVSNDSQAINQAIVEYKQ